MRERTFGSLFKEEPRQWGLRGDPFLWRKIRKHFSSVPLPTTTAGVEQAVRDAFAAMTGRPVSHPEPFVMDEFSHGGMSSGGISPEFWRDEAIPLLRRRLTLLVSQAAAFTIETTALASSAKAIQRDFHVYLAAYDERKYPPPVLDRLRLLFGHPKLFQPEDIELALRWKFGHLGKENYPDAQRQLARRIAGLWPDHQIRPHESPADVLARWRELVGPTSYITMCFLIHLVSSDEWPILDQHNFRAVRYHLDNANVALPDRAAPSTARDLELVRDFSSGVRGVWTEVTGEPSPSPDALDRYLMMFGKHLKARARTRLGAGEPRKA